MTIHFEAQNWGIEIDLENGSLFRRCRYREHKVFRDFNKTESSIKFPQYSASNFPLLPFSNRIKNGLFEFEGQTREIALNAPNQMHPLHGYGWLRPWQVKFRDENKINLSQMYHANDWPWDYEGQQTISVSDHKLRLELRVINRSNSSMPAGIGFHPYFPDLEHAMLTFNSEAVWDADDEVLPTEKTNISESFDLSGAKPLKTFDLDHCYEGVSPAHISWSNSPLKLTITSSENLSRAAIYTAHEDNCFCFEPISHTHNAINMTDPEAEGLVFLEPGQTISGWCEISVEI